MYLRTERWKNGSGFTPVDYYKCNNCECEICEAHSHMNPSPNTHYCWDCSFIVGLLDEKEFLKWSSFGGMPDIKVAIREGKVHYWTTKKPPWEMPDKAFRKTKEYRVWRSRVFERDNHTCKHCGSQENLQAHHIKPFSTHIKLRFKVSNGLTLCDPCHKAVHKKQSKKASG